MPRRTLTFIFIAAAFLLHACATIPPAQNLMGETDDLGLVADVSLQLAGRYGEDSVIVVFDIDNTLLAMEQGLGSDQWYEWQTEMQAEDRCNPLLVADRLAVQGALFYASAMRPTQPDAAQQVTRLQNKDIPVIALSSRGPEFRLQTFRELRRNGYRFWPTALAPKTGYPENFIPGVGSRTARYEDGVFLTAGQNKGEMLKALLDKTGTPWPTILVVVDDKQRNLQAVLDTFNGSGTLVHAWRYSREDDNVAAFNGYEATRLWLDIQPSLQLLRDALGPDHYDFPEYERPEGCDTLEKSEFD